MSHFVTTLGRGIMRLVYPKPCLICDVVEGESYEFRHGLCTQCLQAVITDPLPVCPHCAKTVGPHTNSTNGCTECRGETLIFERALRLGSYDGKLRDAILRMKFLPGEGLADLMGRVFAERLEDMIDATTIDVIAPIPLHWWRKWVRGYNQSESIARELAQELNVPFAPHLLSRVRHVTPQTQSTRAERRENLRGAFQIRRKGSIAGLTILLVDDVMTTGSTASEAARTLRNAGASSVLIAVLARR